MKNQVNAVVIKLSIGVFSNQRQDRQITEEVKIKKSLGQNAGKWVKYKLPDESLTRIRKFCSGVRQFHYDHTSPWEEGYRLLSAKARAHYVEGMTKFKTEFEELIAEFGTQYPNWIEQAKIMHAATFEPSDYPTWEVCKTTFHLLYEIFPVPQSEHFNKDMQQFYGEALDAITAQKIEAAVTDAWERLLKPVQAMAERLASPDAVFRDSLVENVKEMVALTDNLNITNDPKLVEAAKVIQDQLGSLNAAVLRDSKVDRKEAVEKAQNIVARFGALGKRKLAAA